MHSHQQQDRDMPLASLPASVNITRKAERELSAFLRAAATHFDARSTAGASEVWLHIMEGLEWSGQDVEKFFRTVSVRAIAQLVERFTPETI